ncbi:MAG: Ni/Fe-hydrogenase, b-type cytochrome subunit [Thermocrinis sp.]|nr:Ni/Fe-hydrogenase, b-type cytochrome subunit [Thermocrinis sp.]
MKEELVKRIYIYSPSLRIWHWINALCITILFITGLYIGNPFFIGSHGFEATYAYAHNLTMDFIRFIHFSAGYVLTVMLLFRFFLLFFNKGDRLIIPKVWRADFWKGIGEMVLYYLFIKPQHRTYIRNPLAKLAYFVLYLGLIFMVITGFAIYGLSNPSGFWAKLFGWIVPLLGGEFWVHIWHHWFAWLIVFFVIIHVYLVIRFDVIEKEGEVSSMFNGIKNFKETPVDVEDVA